MLPTKGYFQDIECPYFDSTCNRPYCHFRHRKKTQETIEEVANETPKEVEVPTYKPTPKSELANIKSHIPISYVPDLAFRSDRTIRPLPKFTFEKPTYKPTPLSILSSASKRENVLEDDERETSDIEAIREVKQNIANDEYNPEISLQDDINFEDLSAEFDMIDDLIEEPKNKESKENNVGKEETHQENDKDKEKPASDKTEKKHSSSSSKSHKSKYHKKDTKDKSKDKHVKEKDVKSDKSREKDRRSDHKSKHKSSREKEKSKSKHKDKRRSRSRSRERHKEKEKRAKEKQKEAEDNKKRRKSSESSGEDSSELLYSNNFDEIPALDFDDDEEDTLSECYKIFKEYEPPKVEVKEPPPAEPEVIKEETNASKKRIAHSSANPSEGGSKINYVKPKIQANPAQAMANRFKLAKLAQANNEQKNLMNEVKQTVKRPAPSLLEAARNYKLQRLAKPKPSENANVIDSILNSAKNKPKKIAPVQNVNSIQRAKARIEELAKQKATETLNKTPAQTVKGKRIAHVPDISLSDIPDVLNADKSKLPINVRTRFLTMIADECVKLYLIKEDAYTRALNEEFVCYEKCKVLATYKNSAMLAVNRLRKELQERDRLGLGPIGEGEAPANDTASNYKGAKFYNHIKGYALTNEELDIHGYPRESATPGRATIKNRKTTAWSSLRENQRKCSRCGKIYLVDEDGFVQYPEECIYHPLKKRTLRGEQTYLCCKSNDDVGCATSNTHVSEACGDAELEGFQTTMEPESEEDPRSQAVYALDCEMCYTIKGLELTRVTIVDSECKTVYETLVKPLNPIIDYNTTFSGITKEQMERTSTSILQVQANILHLCNSKTILIGHSLESDMKALKIIHGTVIDTSVLFPHKMGLPHKRALKALASDFLKKIIQNSVSGHDSAEDAITCMELVKWKLREELKVRGIK
ncbi:RNA exonuclease 1 homolog [Tribolium castaneum]|uniref:RNA exonuclease 1 homolog-like Protein n=1 Tax=Tribolium castaneum TaxID=7070 RepID=D6WGM7_TRICA|nr:PREDICTED: RNA exonuclease 1 homolog [Tribolium castaneum]EFA00159.1 RNA exonuclease 1 homolog-like Protein [Tribolium castaneum]|eukprot:XP_008190899.1 PREDICTED: RNA exonuclease 1 homolog [Tribolium castaneum]